MMMKKKFKNKKIFIITALIVAAVLGGIGMGVYWYFQKKPLKTKPVKVGILHSLTGTMAASEKAVVDATRLAIEEINQKGGVLGREIELIVADGASDWKVFAEQAEKLITQDEVVVIFGCWTSASRKSVKPVVEKFNNLLFYPVQYEGLEDSQNIFYTGAAPNQQIVPAVTWCFNNIGKKYYLVGSDYIFPRAANEIIKHQLEALGGTVLGEKYIKLGSKEVDAIINDIKATKPDVILNTINGDSNVAFFSQLRNAGITSEKIPVMSFSVAEQELVNLNDPSMIGHYAAWSYFQSLRNKKNIEFVESFKRRYGAERVVSDPMEAAYFGVYLWAISAQEARSFEVDKVREALRSQSYDAPEGIVSIEQLTQHTWKFIRIGKITANNQFIVIWDSGRAVKPVPYPTFKDKDAWQAFLESWYTQWGNTWEKN
jgi:urea transport system substrate-binding protein